VPAGLQVLQALGAGPGVPAVRPGLYKRGWQLPAVSWAGAGVRRGAWGPSPWDGLGCMVLPATAGATSTVSCSQCCQLLAGHSLSTRQQHTTYRLQQQVCSALTIWAFAHPSPMLLPAAGATTACATTALPGHPRAACVYKPLLAACPSTWLLTGSARRAAWLDAPGTTATVPARSVGAGMRCARASASCEARLAAWGRLPVAGHGGWHWQAGLRWLAPPIPRTRHARHQP